MPPAKPLQRKNFAVFSRTGPVRMPVSAISPSTADLELMRVVAIAQYLVGGFTLLLAACVMADLDAYSNRVYLAFGGIAVILAGVRYLQKSATTLRHARVSNLAGLVFITVIVAFSRPIGSTPAFYLWPLMTAAYFLPRRDLALVFGLFMAFFAIALWGFTVGESETRVYFPMVLVAFVVTGLVRLMRENLAALIGDLELSASTDELTDLPNRASFLRNCRREVDRSRRHGAPFSVVMLDLDHFKQVNDRLGHAAGDEALKRCAALLKSECRGGDVPARYGGEEFVIALSDTDLEEALRFAERLRARIETATAGDASPLTASMGVARLHATHDGVDGLIESADAALYLAKNAGRNRVERAAALPA
jgi:diguanylate cyclase (GGDEF)-like protein